MANSKLCLVVPCFNEERRLNVPMFKSFLFAHREVCILFVNDGSRDQTHCVLETLKREVQGDQVSVLSFAQNQGKKEAVRSGMLSALESSKFSFVGFWDADLATPLEESIELAKQFIDKPEVFVVMGARVQLLGRKIERKLLRHYLGRVFATAASFTLNTAVYDTQCGAKIFRSNGLIFKIFAEPFISKWIFDVEILARMKYLYGKDLKTTVIEYPLPFWQHISGSKVKPSDFFRAFIDLCRIFWKYRMTVGSRHF